MLKMRTKHIQKNFSYGKAATAVLIIYCCVHVIEGVPQSDFIDFGLSTSDYRLLKADDSIYQFPLIVEFLFYDKSHTDVYVNSNGILSFGIAGNLSYTPSAFPREENVPVVAPFWADVDNRGTGDIWVHLVTEDDDPAMAINTVKDLIADHFTDFPEFVATEVIVVTWDHVGYYYRKTDKTNTFQCALASDGTNTFAIFFYLDDGINWTTGDVNGGINGIGGVGSTPAQAGFDAGNQETYRVINGSLTNDIINIDEKSNVGVPGLFIFQINGIIREAGEEACPVIGSNACYQRIKHMTCLHLSAIGSTVPIPCNDILNP